MKRRWTDFIVPTIVCVVFPVVIPLFLLAAMGLVFAAAFKNEVKDEV